MSLSNPPVASFDADGKADPASRVNRNRERSRSRRNVLVALAFLAPSLVGFVTFNAGPLIGSMVISLFEWNLISSPSFIGLENYRRMLFDDPRFWTVMSNTFWFVIGSVPVSVVLGLGVALLLNRGLRALPLLRAAYFVPVVVSVVASSLVWIWLFNPSVGLVNVALRAVGVSNPPDWLTSTTWALPALVIVAIWKNVGYNMVIYLAGLKNIPPELQEAMRADGANRLQRLWHLTLPLLRPTTFFILVISVINSFQVFGLALVMTEGGPGLATNTIVYYIYQQGFQNFRMGYAAALGWALFIVVLAITLLQAAVNKRREA